MLQNRTWTDRKAEAEFWSHMQRIEALHARLAAAGRWTGILSGSLFRREALQRDVEALRGLAQDLGDRHTVVVAGDTGRAVSPPIDIRSDEASAPLRTLAAMVVSLRQDRTASAETGEEKSA